jgi:hypothetical protein
MSEALGLLIAGVKLHHDNKESSDGSQNGKNRGFV